MVYYRVVVDEIQRRPDLFPTYLAQTEPDSLAWHKSFIQTFLERDIPQWGLAAPPITLLRFWTMLAHYHGQRWNAVKPARSLSVGEPTVRRYLDILTGVFMIRQLQPWQANLKKRQIKAPMRTGWLVCLQDHDLFGCCERDKGVLLFYCLFIYFDKGPSCRGAFVFS